MTGTYYLSQEGLEKLKEELTHRERVLRREIAEKIGTAKDQGDLSENFEYQESKDQQALNESRIIELRDIISRSIITEKDDQNISIHFGSTFTVQLPSGENKVYTMVGSTEADPMSGKISNDSPLGKSFIGKQKGDIVELEVPAGTVTYHITHIH